MPRIAVIGAGPAGLFAAERLSAPGHELIVFDRMPMPARKFLLAGRGGLNLTHSEPLDAFIGRYGEAASWIGPMIREFSPADMRAWAKGLGQPCFVGSSGRVFPVAFKAAPLLRAWLRRLDTQGVVFRASHILTGIAPPAGSGGALTLRFATPAGDVAFEADAAVLALGGASWPRLGSDGGWVALLRSLGVGIAELAPANCGLRIGWSAHVAERFAGAPLKRIRLSLGCARSQGDAVITRTGLEGGAVYPLSPALRHAEQRGDTLLIDLRPDLSEAALAARLGAESSLSLANRLRRAGLSPAAAALVREVRGAQPQAPLAALIKALPFQVEGPEPIARAISTAGGIRQDAVDERLMLRALPGIFAAGEMLDWEAPTGGYLLQACFATAAHAAQGLHTHLSSRVGSQPGS